MLGTCAHALAAYGRPGLPFKPMKFVYVNTKENRLCTIAYKEDLSLQEDSNLVTYAVTDDFDLSLLVKDEVTGEESKIEGAISYEEFLRRYEADYKAKRISSYPKVEEQLDMLWHAMDENKTNRLEPFYSKIKNVKEANPKN